MRVKIEEGGYMPQRSHPDDAGADLRSPIDTVVPSHGRTLIDTKVALEIPVGYVGFIKSRSGMMCKHGIISGEGVIDSSYRGTITVLLENHSPYDYMIKKGDRISQIVILPCLLAKFEQAPMLDDGLTGRGSGGFGSSGK